MIESFAGICFIAGEFMEPSPIIHFTAALFAVMNPLGNLPLYISATTGERSGVQRYVALFLALFVALMLLGFLWSGNALLEFFGISLPAFRIAGGIILLLNGIAMVAGHEGKKIEALAGKISERSDLVEAENQFRIILIPIGIPIFVGPGSISTVILFSGQAGTIADRLGMSAVIVGMALFILLLLLASKRIGRLLGTMGLDIAARLMGLILAAMGIQFMLAGLADVTLNWIDPSKLAQGLPALPALGAPG
jgi:MarC family membrane protein